MSHYACATSDPRTDVPISTVGDAFAMSVAAADMTVTGADFNGLRLEVIQTRLNDLPIQAYTLRSDDLPNAAQATPQEGFPYKTLTLHFNDGITAKGVITAITVENAAFGHYGSDDIIKITYDGHFTDIDPALDGSAIAGEQSFTIISHVLKGAEDTNVSITWGEYPDALVDYSFTAGSLQIAADQGETLVIDQQPDVFAHGGGGYMPQNLIGYAWERPGFSIIIEGGGNREPVYNPPNGPIVPSPGSLSLLIALGGLALWRHVRPTRAPYGASTEPDSGPAPQDP